MTVPGIETLSATSSREDIYRKAFSNFGQRTGFGDEGGSHIPQQDGLLLDNPLFLKPQCNCQISTLTGTTIIKVHTTPERNIIIIENTQKACLISRILVQSYPSDQSPSEGTESSTCIDERMTDRLANTNISRPITLSRYKAVDQYGIL